jgi:ATP-dependent DNA helicase RecQ
MAKHYPTTATEFRRIPGVGEQKWKDFADVFLGEIKNYLAANPRRTFSADLAALRLPDRLRLNDSQRETLRRFRGGESVDDISGARGFVRSTVYDHLEAAIKSGESLKPDRFFTAAQREEIASAFRKVSDGKLADVRSLLDGKYDYGELRIFRALANRELL